MGSKEFTPERIFVEQSVEDLPFTGELLDQWSSVPVKMVGNAREAVQDLSGEPDPIGAGKRSLLIAQQRGPFIKLCPGTKKYICCGYRTINVATNCNLDCTYCILQSYLTIPFLVAYANLEDLTSQLDNFLASGQSDFYRLGTGELTDSLSLDPVFHHARQLIPYFADKSNAILELKTKTTHVDDLLHLRHGGRTVVSWSLNTDSVVQKEEQEAPPVLDRLKTARRCDQAGYRIGFHFDPLIEYPGWEKEYRQVVDDIFQYVNSEAIAWISLGALRYPPELNEIIRRRHPQSKIVLGELFPGDDGKLRYFKPIRVEMFRKLHTWIKEHDPGVFVYLCMESDQVWRQALGWSPGNMATLSRLLDQRVQP